MTIEGRNFLLKWNEGIQRTGFYKVYWLEAQNPQEAEDLAVGRIRADQKLRDSVVNPADDPPTMHLESLTEVESFDGVPSLESGYVFYPEDESQTE